MLCPYIIGVSGGSASGKTSVCTSIRNFLGKENCSILTISSSFSSETQSSLITFPELTDVIKSLKSGNQASHKLETCFFKGVVFPTKIIMVEGNTIFCDKELRDVCDLKVFVQTDDDERLARKILEGCGEKGVEVLGVIDRFRKVDKPEYEGFVGPSVKYADLIVLRGAENYAAMDMIKENLLEKIKDS